MRGPGYNLLACGCTHCLNRLDATFAKIVCDPKNWTQDEIAVLRLEANSALLSATLAERTAPYTMKEA